MKNKLHSHARAAHGHVVAHKKKYMGIFLFAMIVLVAVHAHAGMEHGPILTIAFYKIAECIGDVTIDRIFPDTFLRGDS